MNQNVKGLITNIDSSRLQKKKPNNNKLQSTTKEMIAFKHRHVHLSEL